MLSIPALKILQNRFGIERSLVLRKRQVTNEITLSKETTAAAAATWRVCKTQTQKKRIRQKKQQRARFDGMQRIWPLSRFSAPTVVAVVEGQESLIPPLSFSPVRPSSRFVVAVFQAGRARAPLCSPSFRRVVCIGRDGRSRQACSFLFWINTPPVASIDSPREIRARQF